MLDDLISMACWQHASTKTVLESSTFTWTNRSGAGVSGRIGKPISRVH